MAGPGAEEIGIDKDPETYIRAAEWIIKYIHPMQAR